MKNILLVDDHEIVRDAFRFFFIKNESYQITGEASNGEEALSLLKDNTYDLLITDINMPKMDGIELVQQIKALSFEIKILVLSMADDVKSIKKMLALNINGYILKETGKEELMNALHSILNGENYFSTEVGKRIMESMTKTTVIPKRRLTVDTELTQREKEVLQLIIEEKSNQEIADALYISVRTVEGHKNNMLIKTGCKNLVGLTLYAIENKLVAMD